MLKAQITNFSYVKTWREKLETFKFKNINDLPSKALVNFKNKKFALSKGSALNALALILTLEYMILLILERTKS